MLPPEIDLTENRDFGTNIRFRPEYYKSNLPWEDDCNEVYTSTTISTTTGSTLTINMNSSNNIISTWNSSSTGTITVGSRTTYRKIHEFRYSENGIVSYKYETPINSYIELESDDILSPYKWDEISSEHYGVNGFIWDEEFRKLDPDSFKYDWSDELESVDYDLSIPEDSDKLDIMLDVSREVLGIISPLRERDKEMRMKRTYLTRHAGEPSLFATISSNSGFWINTIDNSAISTV